MLYSFYSQTRCTFCKHLTIQCTRGTIYMVYTKCELLVTRIIMETVQNVLVLHMYTCMYMYLHGTHVQCIQYIDWMYNLHVVYVSRSRLTRCTCISPLFSFRSKKVKWLISLYIMNNLQNAMYQSLQEHHVQCRMYPGCTMEVKTILTSMVCTAYWYCIVH